MPGRVDSPTVLRRRPIVIALVSLVLLVVGGGAWLFRVEDIPDELPPLQGDPSSITIPPLSDEPPLSLAALGGKTSFFVIVGAQSGKTKEGEALNRALNRWVYPDTTAGYIIGDAEGFEVFRDRVVKIMEYFGEEMRYPVYIDFQGAFLRTFQLPKGHHGFVVMGPDGSVLMRKSGGIEKEDLAEVQAMLGAREPDEGGPAPALSIGALDLSTCTGGHACAIVFLGRSVARREVPYIEDGFEGEDDEVHRRMQDPAVRFVSTIAKMEMKDATGLVVGRVSDVELKTWTLVDEAPDARAAFGLTPTDSAIVVIAGGVVQVKQTGLVRMYQWGRVSDLLGVEVKDEDED